jgi:hypothetical protein
MSDSNWGVRFAVIGSLLAIAVIVAGLWAMTFAMGKSEGFHEAEAQNYAAQYPADTDERISNCPTDSVTAFRECVEEAVSDARDAQLSESDLNAQREMAEWAKWLTIISLVTLFVSALGLWALLRTIQQGRDGLMRAHEANEIARNAQRPWLSIKDISVRVGAIQKTKEDEMWPDYQGEGPEYQIDLVVKVTVANTGSEPALRVKASAEVLHDWPPLQPPELASWFALRRGAKSIFERFIAPDSSETFSLRLHLNTTRRKGAGSLIMPVSFIYSRHGSTELYETSRAYKVGKSIDEWGGRGLTLPELLETPVSHFDGGDPGGFLASLAAVEHGNMT